MIFDFDLNYPFSNGAQLNFHLILFGVYQSEIRMFMNLLRRVRTDKTRLRCRKVTDIPCIPLFGIGIKIK
jgi:hypothetical protein